MLSTLASLPEVPQWRHRVLVDGVPVEGVTSWRVGTTLGDPVGASIIRSGRGDASGSVTLRPELVGGDWEPGAAVLPPSPGRVVTVEVSADGIVWTPVGTLLADQPWDDSTGACGTSLVGPWDRLAHPFWLGPLLSTMPAPPDWGTLTRRSGIHHAWLFEHALSTAGFTVVCPPMTDDESVILQASLMGSYWPTWGLLQGSDANAGATVSGVEWGYCLPGGSASWLPDFEPWQQEATVSPGTFRNSQLRFLVSKTHSQAATLRMAFTGDVDHVKDATITIGADRSITVSHNGGTFTLPGSKVGVAVQVSVADDIWTIESEGGSAKGWIQVSNAGWDALVLTSSAGARIGGLQWCIYPPGSDEAKYRPFAPDAVIVPGATLVYLMATPRVDETTCGAFLDELCRATMSSLIVGEDGVLRVQPWSSVGANPTVPTLTAERDLLGTLKRSWSLRDLASGVAVKRRDATFTLRGRYTEPVWTGSGDDLPANETQQTWIDVPKEEDWLGVDLTMRRAEADTLGPGTLGGGLRQSGKDADGDPILVSVGGYYSGNIYAISHSRYLVEERSAVDMTRKGPPLKSWGAWQNKPLPIVRAYAKIRWSDQVSTRRFRLDHDDPRRFAAVFTLDAGGWMRADHVARTLDLLVSAMGSPKITLDGLTVHPDPRIQLGDKVTLTVGHTTITAIVTGKELAGSAGGALSMSLAVAVTSLVAPGDYAGLRDNAAAQGQPYQGLASTQRTYTDLPSMSQGDALTMGTPATYPTRVTTT